MAPANKTGFWILFLLAASLIPRPAVAHHLLERHELTCSKTFPCPPELSRRIDFWIEVFHAYGDGQVVFHDSKKPERVYAVLKTKARCRKRRQQGVLRRERNRIKNILYRVADKMVRKETKWREEEKHLLGLFPNQKPSEIRKAARYIRCQEGNRDRFLGGLKRYGVYRDIIIEALRQTQLPEDIQYLPFVESAYNPNAYSHLGAAGLWQIMPRTARNLGLRINAAVDERFDPETATRAAMRYLQDSNRELSALAISLSANVQPGDINPFVITSYNYGVAGMRRAMRKVGPDFVAVLSRYRARKFRTAVRNFYASFLAARHVARNASRYFGSYSAVGPQYLNYDRVLLMRPVSAKRLTETLHVSQKVLRDLNPALTRRVWKGWRLVPAGYRLRLPKREGGWDTKMASLLKRPTEKLTLSGDTYRVMRGDTACEIARTFGARCSDLIDANGLGRRAVVRVGQILTVPSRAVKVAKAVKRTAGSRRSKRLPQGGKQSVVNRAQTFWTRIASLDDSVVETSPGRSAPWIFSSNGIIPRTASQYFWGSLPGSYSSRPFHSPRLQHAQLFFFAGEAGQQTPSQAVSDYSVTDDLFVTELQSDSETTYSVRVELEETLGHYADWLGIGYTQPIRRFNNLKSGKLIRVGEVLQLPIANKRQKKEFEKRRIEYHRILEDEFRERYEIAAQDVYRVKTGDSSWTISTDLDIPLWLLKRFNPDIFYKPLQVGDALNIPILREREYRKSG